MPPGIPAVEGKPLLTGAPAVDGKTTPPRGIMAAAAGMVIGCPGGAALIPGCVFELLIEGEAGVASANFNVSDWPLF